MSVTVQRLGIHGEGIGYWHGYTLFVDGALPGEMIRARITEQKRHYGRAKVTTIETVSPNRVKPVCPLFGTCGGCQVMHMDYQEQLVIKRQRVVDALERIGKIITEVDPCVASPKPLHYRNKTQLSVRPGPVIGFNESGSHNIVQVDHCYIHCELGQKVYEALLPLLKGISGYDWNTFEGFLRTLIIKTAINTSEVLVCFVTNGDDSEVLKEVATVLMKQCPEVKGVVQNINTSKENSVLGKETRLIAGKLQIQEVLCGLKFHISTSSFFQVNTEQAEQLYLKALEFGEVKTTDVVLDAYCGVGTLSLLFAKHAKKVIGIECISEAIQDAKENANLNQMTNVEFICGEVESSLKNIENVDLVILNPPRKGCETSVIQELGKRKPRKILYVSCDPATLARDLALLVSFGYSIDAVQPFDMFPQTAHVETLVSLSNQ